MWSNLTRIQCTYERPYDTTNFAMLGRKDCLWSMFDLIPKNKYSSKESVWPENVINCITLVLTAFEGYETENRMLNYNKTVKADENCIY